MKVLFNQRNTEGDRPIAHGLKSVSHGGLVQHRSGAPLA